jgi:hypothetical protein
LMTSAASGLSGTALRLGAESGSCGKVPYGGA